MKIEHFDEHLWSRLEQDEAGLDLALLMHEFGQDEMWAIDFSGDEVKVYDTARNRRADCEAYLTRIYCALGLRARRQRHPQ